MSSIATYNKHTVPMQKIVAAAMVDSYSDISTAGVQQLFYHWCDRGYKKLVDETLKNNVYRVMLNVNQNTNSATLPMGFDQEIFIGVIHSGKKVSLRLRTDLVSELSYEEVKCNNQCEKCHTDKSICRDLEITEETEIVIINSSTYEKTIIKKLYPNGDYYLETKIPVLNLDTNTVEYDTQKEFITNISLKDCGCVDENEGNIQKIKICRPDIYSCYYAPCNSTMLDAGYKIFEEIGIIQFDSRFKYSKVYLEYRGTMLKKNGQYHVPSVCFETLVNFIKFKAVENKPNVPLSVRGFYWERYLVERGNMRKKLSRFSLSRIIQAVNALPKFEYDYPLDDFDYCPVTPPCSLPAISNCAVTNISSPIANGSTVNSNSFVPFDYAGIVGIGDAPIDGESAYQNNKFKGALGINEIHIDNTIYTQKKDDFTLDVDTGIIDISPNTFTEGSSLIVPTFFKLI